jgi:hypothetical protein
MEFEEQIKQWITIDNQLKQYSEKVKELREKRNNLEMNLKKNINPHSIIKINNDKLKLINSKVCEPLTFKYLEKTLSEIIKNDSQVKQIIEHVKEKREIKYILEIKRITNN